MAVAKSMFDPAAAWLQIESNSEYGAQRDTRTHSAVSGFVRSRQESCNTN